MALADARGYSGEGPFLRCYLFGGSASVSNGTFAAFDLESGW